MSGGWADRTLTPDDNSPNFPDRIIVKVEPIPTLPEGYVAVKRMGTLGPRWWRDCADELDVAGRTVAAGLCHAYADALDRDAAGCHKNATTEWDRVVDEWLWRHTPKASG